jgi:lipopolysaccharide/colanic/teichoic acid biosynthesis glycosyltransferase
LKTGRRVNYRRKITWFVLFLLAAVLIVWSQFSEAAAGFLKVKPHFGSLVLLAYSLLSLTAARLLAEGKLKHPFPYRIAFFFAIIFGLLLLILNNATASVAFDWRWVPIITLGAFIGSFVASNQEMRWWENNAPPSQQVAEQVLASHQGYMNPPARTGLGKRLFDVCFSSLALLLSLPVWLLVTLLIWWEDPGPILFVKNSVGRGGKNFKQFKFRSMILHAEKDTGPISGYENDERVLWFGKFLRKTALDEVPQLINILLGEMSVVGPRPQRTVLVHGYLQEIPIYAGRHRVRPGLAGLAQVVDAYDISPEEKLAWDLLYIEKASIWLDLKLLFSAFYLVFALRWLKELHPELRIRQMLNVEKPESPNLSRSVERQNHP